MNREVKEKAEASRKALGASASSRKKILQDRWKNVPQSVRDRKEKTREAFNDFQRANKMPDMNGASGFEYPSRWAVLMSSAGEVVWVCPECGQSFFAAMPVSQLQAELCCTEGQP